MDLSHKKLEVYQVSLEFVALAAQITVNLPRGQGYLADQLKRSASSTVLNIGEGAGEYVKKEKNRFYRIALRSATESSSTIDIVYQFKHIDEDCYIRANHLLVRIVSMLTRLIQMHEKSGREPLRGVPLRRESLREERLRERT